MAPWVFSRAIVLSSSCCLKIPCEKVFGTQNHPQIQSPIFRGALGIVYYRSRPYIIQTWCIIIYVYIFMYIYICIYTYIHIYIHTYLPTYIHTYILYIYRHVNLEHIRCSLWMLHFDDPKQFDGKSNAVRCSRTIPILELMMPDRSVQKCGTFIWLFILIRFHEGRSWYTVGVWGNINHDIPVICPMFGQTWTHTFRMDWNH